MRPNSCAYSTLWKLCEQNAQFDSNVMDSFLKDTLHFKSVIESKKSEYYDLLTKNSVSIPQYQVFTTAKELSTQLHIPCVVKMNSDSTIGIQTQVIESTHSYKNLYSVIEQLGTTSGVVQDYVVGDEFTVTILVGKQNWVPVGTAQDYKKQFGGNLGLNTFGMGSIAPYTIPTSVQLTIDHIVGVFREHYQFTGFLSCQFIINSEQVWFLECNTRLCDPEFQSMASSLSSNIFDSICDVVENKLVRPIDNMGVNSVTIALVHRDWPKAESKPEIHIPESKFVFCKNNGAWDNNTYYGSLTNSGTRTHMELATELYNFLRTVNTAPYRYRLDIAQ